MNRSCNTTNTKVMLGRVLRSHRIVTAEDDDEFVLNVGARLTQEQVRDLVGLCDTRILLQYMSKGMAKRAYIWHSRFLPVPRTSLHPCSTSC
jgi:hypothetical protein